MAYIKLPEAVARGYALPKQKISLFPGGKFFCESKLLIAQIPKLGYTAVCVRIYLSASAMNGKPGIRIAKRSITTVAKDLKCSKRTVERAIDTLLKHGFLMRKGKWFNLIEPPEDSIKVGQAPLKRDPQQLYFDFTGGGGGNRT